MAADTVNRHAHRGTRLQPRSGIAAGASRGEVHGTRRVPRHSEALDIKGLLRDAEVLLIVPPFAELKYPSLGVHLLQACGLKAGFRVQVLYANLALAAVIGEENYARISNSPMGSFAGERFFARCAYGSSPLGRNARRMNEAAWVIGADEDVEFEPEPSSEKPLALKVLARLEKKAALFVRHLAAAVAEGPYKVVGCSTTFEQTSASVALLNAVKQLRPATLTILGGANCEGEMAQGIVSLGARIDYVFSGESEVTFPEFVSAVLAGAPPSTGIIYGKPCMDLDALPPPDYAEYYDQRKRLLPRSSLAPAETELLFQTSRGCWWGEKQHCTFCGLNGEGMEFRQKSAEQAIQELRVLSRAHPTKKIFMTDNIMPHAYYRTFLPRLAAELPGLDVFFELKSNLSLAQVLSLKMAGVGRIQPGIESLSSRLLKRMKKGVLARQNLLLLRDARAAGVTVEWSVLWGFPGDELEAYLEMLRIVPLLHHLPPPAGMPHISLERFSPYFTRPAEFGIRKLKPVRGYYDFLPRTAEVQRIAYHFTGEYDCESHQRLDVMARLWHELKRWRAAWAPGAGEPREDLRVEKNRASCRLIDTRRVTGGKKTHSLRQDEALDLLSARPASGAVRESWAVEQKLALIVDGWFVPLAVPDPQLLAELAHRSAGSEAATGTPLVHLESVPTRKVQIRGSGNTCEASAGSRSP